MNILVIDVGGTSIKILATGRKEVRRFPSRPKLTPQQMVSGVKELAGDWKYRAVSIGYPGPVLRNRPVAEPHNLGRGWMGFDFEAAFQLPTKVMNDAAMQALGSYRGGKMLFLGLGTGLGSTLIVDGIVEPMELGHPRTRTAPTRTTSASADWNGWARRHGGSTSRTWSSAWSPHSSPRTSCSVAGMSRN
jgi:polyphosphate glucokinase